MSIQVSIPRKRMQHQYVAEYLATYSILLLTSHQQYWRKLEEISAAIHRERSHQKRKLASKNLSYFCTYIVLIYLNAPLLNGTVVPPRVIPPFQRNKTTTMNQKETEQYNNAARNNSAEPRAWSRGSNSAEPRAWSKLLLSFAARAWKNASAGTSVACSKLTKI